MPALESDLRRQLENVIIEAREVAEAAARSKLTNLGVAATEAFNERDREIRNRLRARGRQVGDVRNADKTQAIEQLTQELAYEYWHRMLFARFLAENGLLIDPDLEVGVNLEYCHEVATSKGASNGFVLAARYASKMLPQIFRTDDVLLEIDIAPDQRLALEKLLDVLPPKTFLADDSLGWVYQFWQTKRKKEVNDSGKPIDGRTLPAVTQLFTEHYMVQFLLHNTIGAWWCGQNGIQGQADGAGVPAGVSPVEMDYLRWQENGSPAAGKFEGWPASLAQFSMLDPCCGSGHFLVAAFNLLVPLRMHDEGLTANKACDAVLSDNIFGLELDPRCTQIAAFALAMAAWKYPDTGGYRPLPPLNIACSGQGVSAKKDEWVALANGDTRLREGMERLYDLFQQAPDMGSLINPREQTGDLIAAGFSELRPLLHTALSRTNASRDAEAFSLGVVAQGVAASAVILSSRFSLVATNVPYLSRSKQSDVLKTIAEEYLDAGKQDLATLLMDRCCRFNAPGGTVAVVCPQAWQMLGRYVEFRQQLLNSRTWHVLARLGAGAFETISGEVVNVSLFVSSNTTPNHAESFLAIDLEQFSDAKSKNAGLVESSPFKVRQLHQLKNPDSRIVFGESSIDSLLSQYAFSWQGIKTSDDPRFTRGFWEFADITGGWVRYHRSAKASEDGDGREQVLFWEDGYGTLTEVCQAGASFRGKSAWGKRGIAIEMMGSFKPTLYMGDRFSSDICIIEPKDQANLPAIMSFCESPSLREELRKIDKSLKVTNSTFGKVPFDLAHWKDVSSSRYPNGLDAPSSNDPTQWIFNGDITHSTDPLQVAVARLLGYRWPGQSKAKDAIDELTDSDGILCLPSVRGEPAAEERLLEVLRAAYGKGWSDSVLHKLLTDAGCKAGVKLDDWLRGQFFEQHCKRFKNRPFIWHISDGRKDGFSALVNYHKLDHTTLDNLTHSYIHDWIKEQIHDAKAGKTGADLRLAAAQELQEKVKLILAGDPPYDIFVRWKSLHAQAIGWHPDLNDGVRQNIRPFVFAGILKKELKSILKDKDRGNEPERDEVDFPWFWSKGVFVGDRVNDEHLKSADKQAARTRKKGTK